MSFDVNKLDVVFFQRNPDNSEYEQINISGSNAVFYINNEGVLTADNITDFFKNIKSPMDYYTREYIVGETNYGIDTLKVGTPNRLSKYYAIKGANRAFQTIQTETPTIDTSRGIAIGKTDSVNATLDVSGSVIITGSLVVTEGIVVESASYALSSSYALTSSYVLSSSYALSASYADTSLSASIAKSSSFLIYTPGINNGTASYAIKATTASFCEFALTASYTMTSASFIQQTSSSFASSSLSSSYALSASYSDTSLSSSYFGTGTNYYVPLWVNNRLSPTSSIFNSGSNVGIGTTNPVQLLQVENATGTANISLVSSGSTTSTFLFRNATKSTNAGGVGYNHDTNVMNFRTNTTASQIVIDSIGYTGIGTQTPTERLHVQGNVSASNFIGNLTGTASWSNNSLYSRHGLTSSFASSSLSSSYAMSGSYARNALSSSISGYSTFNLSSSYASSSLSSSYAMSGSYAFNSTTASYFNQKWLVTGSSYPITSSWSINSINSISTISSSYASSSLSSSYAITASNALKLNGYIQSEDNDTTATIVLRDQFGDIDNTNLAGDGIVKANQLSATQVVNSPNFTSTGILSNLAIQCGGAYNIGFFLDATRYGFVDANGWNGNVVGNLTGSFSGTASWANNSLYSNHGLSSSYASSSLSSSYALTASYLLSGSYAKNALSSSISGYSTFNLSSSYASSSLSSSYAMSGSYAFNSTTASYALTSSYVRNAQTASYIGSGTNYYLPRWYNNTLTSVSSVYDDGNVGIGTNSDVNSKLNIYGGDSIHTVVKVSSYSSGMYSSSLYIGANSIRGWNISSKAYSISRDKYDLHITQNSYNGDLILTDGAYTGNVGIGTVLPTSASLTVNGNIWAKNLTASMMLGTSSYALTSSYIGDGTNYYVPLWINNRLTPTSSLYNTINGNVLVGPNSDYSAKLQVYSGSLLSTNGSVINMLDMWNIVGNVSHLQHKWLRTYDGGDWNSNAIRIQHKVDATDMAYIEFNASGSQRSLALGTNDTERVRIDYYGNVGINTKTPDVILDVNKTGGTTYNNDLTYIGRFGTGSLGLLLGYDATYDCGVIAASSQSYGWKNVSICPNGSNVGIGTVLPTSASLTVNGNIWAKNITASMLLGSSSYALTSSYIGTGTNYYVPLWVNNRLSPTSSLYNTVGGNVGIGSLTPSNKLDIYTTNPGGGINIGNATEGSCSIVSIQNGAATDCGLAFKTTYATLQERMRITSTGNVGIGITTPTHPLTVSSSIKIVQSGGTYDDGLQLQDFETYKSIQSYDVSPLALNPLGNNVGIATTSPKVTLDVNGCMRSTANTTATSGSGVEMLFESNIGYLFPYNRNTSQYLQMNIIGSPIYSISTNGNTYFGGNFIQNTTVGHDTVNGIITTTTGDLYLQPSSSATRLYVAGKNSNLTIYGSSGGNYYLALNHNNSDATIASGVGNIWMYPAGQIVYTSGSIIPIFTNTYQIGATTNRWANGYINNLVGTASWATNAITCVGTAAYATNAGYADNAGYASTAGSATTAINATTAAYCSGTSAFANNADTLDSYHASSFAFTGGSNATGTWPITASWSNNSLNTIQAIHPTDNIFIGTGDNTKEVEFYFDGTINSWITVDGYYGIFHGTATGTNTDFFGTASWSNNSVTAAFATNADTLDGYHASETSVISTIVARNSIGSIFCHTVDTNNGLIIGDVVYADKSHNLELSAQGGYIYVRTSGFIRGYFDSIGWIGTSSWANNSVTSAFATNAGACSGTSAFATNAGACSGTSAFATNAGACAGTSAYASNAGLLGGYAANQSHTLNAIKQDNNNYLYSKYFNPVDGGTYKAEDGSSGVTQNVTISGTTLTFKNGILTNVA